MECSAGLRFGYECRLLHLDNAGHWSIWNRCVRGHLGLPEQGLLCRQWWDARPGYSKPTFLEITVLVMELWRLCYINIVTQTAGSNMKHHDLFCREPRNGVFEILLSTASISGNSGTVSAPLVSGSIDTSSNDGMNCLERTPSPFDTTTTTTKMGGGDGDPHIHTFDGEHYLLLNQGSNKPCWTLTKLN